MTAVGVTTGGGAAGASSVVFGGVAAKVAAVVVAGAVVGGGTYEGVTHVVRPAARNAQPPAAHVEFAPAKSPGIAQSSTVLTFETPKLVAPSLGEPSRRANGHALRAVREARSVARRSEVAPPGETVKTLAHTPARLRSTPPGLALKATRAAKPASAHSPTRAGQSRRRTPVHPVHPPTALKKLKSAQPTLPHVSRGRQTRTDTLPDDPAP